MIIYGWGKDSKELGYAGLHKCENCKNYSHYFLHEIANNVKLYFVKVAKFNRKYYMVCSICNAGYELEGNRKDEVLRWSMELPSVDTIDYIWNVVCEQFGVSKQLAEDTNLPTDQMIKHHMDCVHDRLNGHYADSDIGYVMKIYYDMLVDEDMPN